MLLLQPGDIGGVRLKRPVVLDPLGQPRTFDEVLGGVAVTL